MAGAVEPAPALLRWVDIENLQRYPDIFADGESVVATEKIHGTACLVTLDVATDRLWVSSKGHGEKNLALVESDRNLYWRAVRAYDLKTALRDLASDERATRVAVFGEVYGAGVQDLGYGANAGYDATLGFRAFDIKLDADDGVVNGERWVDAYDFQSTCDLYDIPAVPVLYKGPFDLDALRAAASGPTVVGDGAHIREGVVIRPAVERRSDVLGGRAIAKLVSPDYLTRKGHVTEYE
jgi:RNA ligase (TIGR02306 family)